MLSSFEKDIIKEINKFRCNPKSIQHLCEILYKDFQRINSNSPFLQEAESFIKQLESMEPLPELIYNEELSEAAKKELPNFRERKNYQNFKQGNSLKGIVPDHYLITSPLLVAIYKFEENKNENMVIIILATKFIENKSIKLSENDFLINNEYGPLAPETEEGNLIAVCPNCSSAIEILSINNVNNSIEYNCLKEKKNFSMKIKEYLDKLKEKKENNKDEIKDKCKIHKNKEYISYCLNCNVNLCKECLKKGIHINHKKIINIEVKPTEEELHLIEDIIEYYQKKIENLRIEIYNNKIEGKELLNEDKKNENKKLEKEIKKNKIKENKELEINENNFINDLEKIKKEYENKIKLRKKQYIEENINIYNKYKLMNEKQNIKHKTNPEKTTKNYENDINNVENIIKINKIILNNYNTYNNNYFNSVNIKNLLLSYLKNNFFNKENDKILKKNIKDKYKELIKELNDYKKNSNEINYQKIKIASISFSKNSLKEYNNPKFYNNENSNNSKKIYSNTEPNVDIKEYQNNSFITIKKSKKEEIINNNGEIQEEVNEKILVPKNSFLTSKIENYSGNNNIKNTNNSNNNPIKPKRIVHLKKTKNEIKQKTTKKYLTILKRTFFQDNYQRYIKNEKITDYDLDELSKEVLNDKQLGEDEVVKNTKLFIETRILPIIQQNKINEDELRIVKYNISKILNCLGLDENSYESQYYPKMNSNNERKNSQEEVNRFRQEFGVDKDMISDEELKRRLKNNNFKFEKTFMELYD